MKLIDIGVNLTDECYNGEYNGKQKRDIILERGYKVGVERIMITAGRLSEIEESIKLIKLYNSNDGEGKTKLYTTIGVHPTRCTELESNGQEYIDSMVKLYEENKDIIVACGEFGLDYDRLHFCSKEVQLKNFELQFQLVTRTNLPLFLHLRNAFQDFVDIIRKHRHEFKYGVVHSFDGTPEQIKELVELDLYIGINGCSLKTEDNLKAMATIPADRLLIETDAPWCGVRKTHPGYKFIQTQFETVKKEPVTMDKCVQNRNEPCHLINIMEIIAGYRKENIETLSQTIYNTTMKIYFNQSTSTTSTTTTNTN